MPHWVDVLPEFLVAAIILAALPGPATALFLQRSVRDGRSAGLAAVVGNEIGILGWTLAGGTGLSILLAVLVLLLAALVLLAVDHLVGQMSAGVLQGWSAAAFSSAPSVLR